MLRRRALLRAVSGAAVASLVLSLGRPRRARASGGSYGQLVPDPAGILELPPGFSYRILEQRGAPMDDGLVVPGLPDGMTCFPGPDDTLILMRNHELVATDGPYAMGFAPLAAYDINTMGCVTRLVLDAASFDRISSNLVLCGTLKNCAGGPSPWGWLSCEETTVAGHGYVFACDPAATSVQPPQRITAYGRYKHEAACVDPATHIAYLTEDQTDSAMYRFVPDDPATPFVGRLQALKIVGHDLYDMSNLTQGQTLSIAWVDIADPDPVDDTVRHEAQTAGAAVFNRGEGIAFFNGEIFMIATSGGPIGKGQIFRIVDHPQAPTIEALLVSTDADVVDQPDNITVAPWGELFFGEDGGGGNYIRGSTQDGQVFDFARNALTTGEFAGVCFSPDGRALFCNLYGSGMTFVITGPFHGAAAPDDPTTTTAADDTGATTGADEPPTASTDVDEPHPTSSPSDGSSTDPANSTTSATSTATTPQDPGGAYEEIGCACSSNDEPPNLAAVVAVAAAIAAAVPARTCDMQSRLTED